MKISLITGADNIVPWENKQNRAIFDNIINNKDVTSVVITRCSKQIFENCQTIIIDNDSLDQALLACVGKFKNAYILGDFSCLDRGLCCEAFIWRSSKRQFYDDDIEPSVYELQNSQAIEGTDVVVDHYVWTAEFCQSVLKN